MKVKKQVLMNLCSMFPEKYEAIITDIFGEEVVTIHKKIQEDKTSRVLGIF